jgi:hypothetical protein
MLLKLPKKIYAKFTYSCCDRACSGHSSVLDVAHWRDGAKSCIVDVVFRQSHDY